MTRAVLVALVLVVAAACGGESAGDEPADSATRAEEPVTETEEPPVDGAPEEITEADAGGSFALAVGAETSLRLSSEYTWDEPAVRGQSVVLAPVNYLQDPGFVEWLVQGVEPGETTIASVGTPVCADGDGCPDAPLEFEVRITVTQ